MSTETEYEGYSDYNHVSQSIVGTINDAVEALSDFRAADLSGAKLKGKATTMHADVLNACWQLRVELEHEATDSGENFADQILEQWYGDGEEQEGWVEILQTTPTREVPERQFLGDLAHSIRRAGWELGYLKAGRENETDDEGDADDAEVTKLIEEMTV